MSKIQDLKGTHNTFDNSHRADWLFLMSKIQDLKGTHNHILARLGICRVVSDVKDTRFERNSQQLQSLLLLRRVVSDVKDTRFERNSQLSLVV